MRLSLEQKEIEREKKEEEEEIEETGRSIGGVEKQKEGKEGRRRCVVKKSTMASKRYWVFIHHRERRRSGHSDITQGVSYPFGS